MLDSYAPAAVLINRGTSACSSLGPTDRYLRVAPGQPTHDLLAMARPGMRTKLRSAIQRARQETRASSCPAAGSMHDGQPLSFSIDVQPVTATARTCC